MTRFSPHSLGPWQLRQRVEEVFGKVEEDEAMEDAPFSVIEEFELGDLSEVREDRVVLPVTSNVLLRVQKASSRYSERSGITSLNVQVALVEGVDIPEKDAAGNFTGNVVKRYANKIEFIEFPYKADPAIRKEPRWSSKNRPYLVPLTQFLKALGYDLKAPPTLGDGFCSEVVGREFRADIIQREVRRKNPVTGVYEGTGEYRHQFKAFRAA